jgi:hypothetical protein
MTSQVTNRRDGGSTSGRGRSRKLRYIYIIYNNKPSKPPRIYENGAKTAGFPHVYLKNVENAVFYLKKLNKIYSQDFFEENINLKKFCNLRHYGVIHIHSFGSQICPEPPGLGFRD